MRTLSNALAGLLAILSVGVATAQDKSGVKVLGPSLTAPTPPAADAAIPVQAGRFLPVTPASGLPIYMQENRAYRIYRIEKGSSFTGVKWDAPKDAEPEAWTAPPEVTGPVYVILARGYVGTYEIQPIKNGKTAADAPEKDGAALRIQILKGPQPPPDVDPTPDVDPKPPVVKSFRVIFVTESGQTLSAVQNGVLYGKAVEEYLTSKTTPEGGLAGWRRYDKDADASKDQPTMAALWKAVQPKVTTVPCMVVEVNGKAEILTFPTSSADALTTLKKYGGQ